MVIVSRRIIKFFELFTRNSFKIGGIAIFPFIFINPELNMTARLVNHERIHIRQQIELLIIPFYIWYFIEIYRKGYVNNRFEREAYENDNNLMYLKNRKWYSFLKY